MVNKKTGSVSTLKSKLIAAIAMLLVGAFMVVSSSYAWFTLSTAPEVTGIYTSVGANGNLEMALVPADGMASITSPVGSTGNNETWGNLVDLGQTTGNQNAYGLDLISLMPARLNTKAGSGDYTYAFNGLQSVNYGADGRPNELVYAVAGKFDKDLKAFAKTADGAATYGVTAYGAASGMSAQQTAYLQYRKEMDSLLTAAQNKADASFETYGNALAEVVMTKAMQGDDATFNIAFVPEMITALEAANQDIIDAAEKYVAVLATMGLYNLDDNTWSGVVSELANLNLTTLGDDATSITIGGQTVEINTTLRNAVNKYNSIKTKLDDAKQAITDSGLTFTDSEADGETVTATAKATTWTNTNNILFATGVLNYNEILVNGKTTDEIKDMMGEDFSMDAIPQDLMDFGLAFVQNGVIDFTSGSGVHADIADIAGEYQASIAVKLTLGTSSFENKNVRLRTKVDSGSAIDLTAGLSTPADNSAAGAVKLLTEYYGYQLDFAFRTNATGSKLQLQTDATGRIYSTDGSDETMGHGSTMTFAVLDNNFTQAQAKALMSTVRIVFMNEAGDIIGLGLLSQDGTGITADANNNLTSAIYLYDFTIDETTGKLNVGDKAESAELMDLAQNTATKLSVLVYMDGDLVDNSMVAAEATASLQGSLNLQFSSTADLKPMEYTEFKGTANNTTTEAATEATTEATN